MRRPFLAGSYLVVVASMLVSGAVDSATAPRSDVPAPTNMNAEVIGVDAEAGTLTLTSETGTTVLQVEGEARAGLSGLREKDKVIVAYQVVDDGAGGSRRVVIQVRPASTSSGEPGPPAAGAAPGLPTRVVGALDAPSVTLPVTSTLRTMDTARVVADTPAHLDAIRESAARDFEVTVAQLATQANAVDSIWLGFQQICLTEPPSTNRSRGWFQLLDGAVPEPDQDGCRQQYNEIIGRGGRLREAIRLGEDAARKAEVLPGRLRETLERHRLDL